MPYKTDPATVLDNIQALESTALEADCMKQACIAVGLDVLILAKQLKTLIQHKKQPAIVAKGLDLAFKIRGDYQQATVDNRPINLNLGWGQEAPSLETIKEALIKMTSVERKQLMESLNENTA